MKFLDCIKHFNSCLSYHLILLIIFLCFNQIFNTIWQVRHDEVFAGILRWVHIVCRNVNFDALLLCSFCHISEKQCLCKYLIFSLIKLHRYIFCKCYWSVFLRDALVKTQAYWIELFDEQKLSIIEFYGEALLIYVEISWVHDATKYYNYNFSIRF